MNSLSYLRYFLVPALILLAALVVAALAMNVEFGLLSRDVASIGKVSPLTGMLSNMGVLLWCASCVIPAFAGSVMRGSRQRAPVRFLFSSAAFSGLLMLDDLFLIHEDLAYRYLGLRERYIMLAWGTWLLVHLTMHARVIMRTRYIMLLLSLGFFTTSVLTDAALAQWRWMGDLDMATVVMLEDGAKWMGIATWASYHLGCAHQFLSEAERDWNTVPIPE